jgi:hypothetical protein
MNRRLAWLAFQLWLWKRILDSWGGEVLECLPPPPR